VIQSSNEKAKHHITKNNTPKKIQGSVVLSPENIRTALIDLYQSDVQNCGIARYKTSEEIYLYPIP